MDWPILKTDRLVLRPLEMDDLDDLAELHAEVGLHVMSLAKRAWQAR